MGDQKSFKRKKYLIDKGFQLAYVGKILVLEAIAVGSTALLMAYMFLFVFNDESMVSSGPWGKGILWSTIVLALVLMVILVYLGIRISHRIAGPMYRFQRTFEDIRGGNLKARVYLRKGDELQPLATAFNAMLDVVSEQVKQYETGEYEPETIHEKVQTVIGAIGLSEMPPSDKDKYRKVLQGLIERL